MIDSEIFFCGLSKNCLSTLKKNIEFIQGFKDYLKNNNIKLLIVDSDSNDGTKDYLNKVENELEYLYVINEDRMEIESRVERIKNCRNLCLDFINKKKQYNKVIYVPFDSDIFLFSKSSYEKFELLIKSVLEKNNNSGIFPVSLPFYYDIFALRAKGWLNFNSQLIVSNLKKTLKVGSFIWNYLFIFRYQLTPEKIKMKKFKLYSAFGGIGIYDLSGLNLETTRYEISQKSPDLYSEHIFFNKHFNDLEIKSDWIIDAPKEHVLYKSYDRKKKFRYIQKTFKNDMKSFFNNSKKRKPL